MLSTTDKVSGISNLRQQAEQRLRAAIVTGEIVAGQLYTVATFAAQLGVSATPVREALFDLEDEGLVEVVRNRGFRVTALTRKDLDEIFELRFLLEVPSTAKLAGRLTAEELSALDAIADDMERHAGARDIPAFLETDRRFHLRLLSNLGNRRLCEIVGRLRDQSRLYGIPKLMGSDAFVVSAREHRGILSALEEGRPDSVRTLVAHHLESTRAVLAGLLEKL